ncbi:cysteine--1-D-myo-inosityl 2-amino-2-deoxy-alpha-D-glucopyranoside ligase [Rothia sp. AR01]|uniref:L-cysteine:1D-myo-inositol 2-amino-2-deoxy-alpha-D-glucopyranoside ligase n=1 Tax=Rothia santali TaxID=2949643 RepID=A0A9X2HBC3_9MICC|nr:cysteine--1-D-myo-inosityl 2-amino-2-deoxy-alpha-D-glucopyranoside ligase [Rothia santali]MCP3424557.1 cysteine--1-D-myo-inosityl 2-amino-2-deoxy-alpha-D-glucopyranoside ligase [Rothia santali]
MRTWSSPALNRLGSLAPVPSVFDSRLGEIAQLPEAEETAGLYVCGITPYDATHMGHAATYITFDLLVRAWVDAGKSVTYVQNVTDVDDPLLDRARDTDVDWRDLAQDQTDLFRADMEALSVVPPDHYIPATEAIDWLVPWVERMIEDGLAYRVPAGTDDAGVEHPEGDVYFDVRAAADTRNDPARWYLGYVSAYSEEHMAELFPERGGDPGRPGKRDPFDALLWRARRDGEPHWDGGSLGEGRPGWHIECTVIAQRFLGMPYTVQGGGSDLRFPHHEMGAGHAFAMTGERMAEHYVHAGMVGLDGEKMSKSRGNLVLVSALRRQGWDPRAIRLAVLANHYRSDWFWTEDLLTRAEERLATWRRALAAVAGDTGAGTSSEAGDRLVEEVRAALGRDLDSPLALEAVDAWAAGALAEPSRAGSADDVAALISLRLGVEL